MVQAFPTGMSLKLALQGGGAHGAFTWGVLDRLLTIPGIAVSAVSGTSSGAMNGAALAQGWMRGGAAGARDLLAQFWDAVSRQSAMHQWFAAGMQALHDASWLTPGASPQAFNALRPIVEGTFDIESLRRSPIALYVAATRVRDAALTVFHGDRLTHDALLASACLPPWHPLIEIDGEGYWDGGFAGNPTLEPLLGLPGDDILCVLVQPLRLSAAPQRPRDMIDISVQQAFGAAFWRELRDLASAWHRIDSRLWLSSEEKHLKRLELHVVAPADALGTQDTRQHRLRQLHEQGWAAADAWWRTEGELLGQRGGKVAWIDRFGL
ncbi:MAG TPA: patatin-like phospholipase family protein [Dyella sp.]|uniref:patatin-like phospholipase family protein n=1 Tax=Dyella sp. TaxID=1869338 RepID=UPI002F9329C5